MNQQLVLLRISQLLARFRDQVKILNEDGDFSINKHAENILIKVLNVIYDCNLENVNYAEHKSYPSIDLRDKAGKIAFQITSTGTFEKVNDTLYKFGKYNLHKKYDKLYVFVVTEKMKISDKDGRKIPVKGKFKFVVEDIIDRTDLYKELNAQNDLVKMEIVCDLLEKQFEDKVKMDKWDVYCKGLSSYDTYIHNLYNYLDIKGFSPKINNTLVKIKLESIYIPLALKPETGEEETLYSIEEALNSFNNLVILGDPGSGKSTILKHLAYTVCADRGSEAQFTELVPVFIKGSEYAKYLQATSKGLAEFIIDQLDKKYEDLFAEKLEEDKLLLLIDGVDEINKVKLRHDVADRINAFIAHYPAIKIIVSSRIVGYKETRLNAHFIHLQVEKFGDSQIWQFARNWYASIAADSNGDLESAYVKGEELYSAIRKNPSVYGMAGTPLLLMIIALIHYQGNTLPEKRAALYEIATSTFLENWVRQREINDTSGFRKGMLIEILSPVSFHIHQNYATGLIAESELEAMLLKEYRRICPCLTIKEEHKDIKGVIDFLRHDAGFLFEKGSNERGESMFGFVHLTFQEYFAAIEFGDRWKRGMIKEDLHEYVLNANWIEVISLTASIFKLTDPSSYGRRTTTNFIRDILNIKDPYPEMHRPLKVVLQLLKDETEMEHDLFEDIIDMVLRKAMVVEDDDNWRKCSSEMMYFIHRLEDLFEIKTYQKYLIKCFYNEKTNPNNPRTLISGLLEIVLGRAEWPEVQHMIIGILRLKNYAINQFIFDAGFISPDSVIFMTSEFHDEMIDYINSDYFAANFKGNFPKQFWDFYKTDREVYRNMPSSKGFDRLVKNLNSTRILTIRLVKQVEMRKALIVFYIKSIGYNNIEEVNYFLDRLSEILPETDLCKIRSNVARYIELDMNAFPIFEHGHVKIFSLKGDGALFAFESDNEIRLFKYPFKEADLLPYFKDETRSLMIFFSIVSPVTLKRSHNIPINGDRKLLVFLKYRKCLDFTWGLYWAVEYAYSYALKSLIAKGNKLKHKKLVINWLQEREEESAVLAPLSVIFKTDDYKARIHASDLGPFDKLFLLHLVGERSGYDHLLRPAIDEWKNCEDKKEKNLMRETLFRVF